MAGGSLFRNPFFWAALAGVVVVTATRGCFRREPEPPPVIGHVPSFAFTDQNGRPFGSKELAGKVWIGSFFFTSCTSICPKLIGQVKKLEDKYDQWGTPIQLVSFTVDPETDTPEKMKAYADRLGVKGDRWHFLRGSEAEVQELIAKGFLLYLGSKETDPNTGVMDIAHSGKLMLVDGALGLRGAYDSDDLGIEEVFHRAQHVWLKDR